MVGMCTPLTLILFSNNNFAVKAGQEELFRVRVKGGDPAKLIKVDITGYNSVTLEVDPGNDLDIADHADWADACFLQSLGVFFIYIFPFCSFV